jgi:hypothetical protein
MWNETFPNGVMPGELWLYRRGSRHWVARRGYESFIDQGWAA